MHGTTHPSTHVYDSGVYFDTAPGEAIGCCDEAPGAPVHDVACSRCGNRRTARHDCPPGTSGGRA